ncbi:hypothetical protein [Saccharicrinis sp. 156]|uniref:hypothetical protein n=1 Tax=Saccharicrinis sp. 156 TaxID=3417574 RepID=UPI003D33928C
MKPTISILGCGWLGIPLAVELIKAGYPTKGSTTSQIKLTELAELKINPYLIDLYDREDRTEFLKADILVIAVPHKDIDNFQFLVSQIHASDIDKVIFISSTSVYPNLNGEVTEETNTLDTALAKIESIFCSSSLFKTTVLRFAGLFGGDRKPGYFFPNGIKIKNPEGFVNLIHLEDCIAIIKTLIEKNIWGEIFNACADTHPTRREFYTKEMKGVGRKPPEFDEVKPSEFKVVSNNKLKKHVNYRFKHPDLMNYR